jgi:hypothetical protein
MRASKLALAALILGFASSLPAEDAKYKSSLSAAQIHELALSAFRSPKIPFEARLMLTEWRQGGSRAEEIRMYFSPPESYRIEFLAFDGSVRKVVMTNEKNAYVSVPGTDNAPLGSPLSSSDLLSDKEIEDLLTKNYIAEVTGTGTFIGRPVWYVLLTPRTDGKPTHELKIDRETHVVLEQRRYMKKDDAGSLTRFSTFEPNKKFAQNVFPAVEDPMYMAKKDDSAPGSPTFKSVSPPPESYMKLPAGFFLKSYRSFEVEGTMANYYNYTDGALPLSVFKTKLPVKFPEDMSASDKLKIFPESGLASADSVFYQKVGKDYFTVIGEVSPELLHDIADHFE